MQHEDLALYSIVSLLDTGSASAITCKFWTPFFSLSSSNAVSSWKWVANKQRQPGIARESTARETKGVT